MTRGQLMEAGILSALFLSVAALVCALLPPRPAGMAHAQVLIDAADQDGDGAIDATEYLAVADPDLPFELVDLNGSGALDAREVVEILVAVDPLCLIRLPYRAADGTGPPTTGSGSGSR